MGITGISSSSANYAAVSQRAGSAASRQLDSPAASGKSSVSSASASSSSSTDASGHKLSTDQQQDLDKLQARDREVRQHEQAHLSAAAGIAVAGPSYDFERGPDGKNYAVGGEVQISISPGRTPEETLAKAQQIERAALAPKDPSGPDRQVAAQAEQMAQDAQVKIRAEGASGQGNASDASQSDDGKAGAQSKGSQPAPPSNGLAQNGQATAGTSGVGSAGNASANAGGDTSNNATRYSAQQAHRVYIGVGNDSPAQTLINAYA